MTIFKKAERKKAKLRLGISGVSGSGKTYSALLIAAGMNGKIAMIDTEAGRGELYGNDFDYDVLEIKAPFSPEKYISAIKCAEENGYNILIIDSLSHAWSGDGGVLDIVSKAGGTYQKGWNKGTPEQNRLIDSIITSKMHIIFTMRSKSEYVLEETTNTSGKKVMSPKKVGMAPIQRDGLEYECTLYMEMNSDHDAYISKDNTKIYDQQYLKPNLEMGKKLIEWLNEGKENEKLNEEHYIKEINLCTSIEQLKHVFKEAYNASECEKYREKITEAKDKKKKEIEYEINKASIEMFGGIEEISGDLT